MALGLWLKLTLPSPALPLFCRVLYRWAREPARGVLPRRDDRSPGPRVRGGPGAGHPGEDLQQIPDQHQRPNPVQAGAPLLQEPPPVLHVKAPRRRKSTRSSVGGVWSSGASGQATRQWAPKEMNMITNYIVCRANGMDSVTGRANRRLAVMSPSH